MKNSKELKTFVPLLFGSCYVASNGAESTASKGSLKETDGIPVMTPPIVAPESPYGASTGINPNGDFYPTTTGGKGSPQTEGLTKTLQIVDTDTGEPIPGVNVYLKKNSKIGSTSGADGFVTIVATAANDVYVFSHQTYGARERIFSDLGGQQNLDKAVNDLDTTTITTEKKNNWLKYAAVGAGLLILMNSMGGSDSKTKSKSSATGLSGTKSKKRKSAKKGKKSKSKKRKGLREPATIEI